ncbi:MAG: hypothetical protein JSS67_05640 [Bacteroidetes bacterium]|nr:hypothetical protein [Bacteroidota bacterium]
MLLQKEEKPVSVITKKTDAYKGDFNPFDPAGANCLHNEHSLYNLIKGFNMAHTTKTALPKWAFKTDMRGYSPEEVKSVGTKISTPEGDCDSTAANCHFNMTQYIFAADRVVKTGKVSYAKNANPIPNYHDVEYADDTTAQLVDDYDDKNNCINVDQCTDDPESLYYYVYYISGINYDNCKFPAIVLSHAGGFSDCSNLVYEDSLCRVLARKGFVVFCVEYRRGRLKDAITQGRVSAQQQLAVYRASQDIRGALRSIIKRQSRIAYNHFPYQIDVNWIFVAGQSAGALATGCAVYYPTQTMMDSIFPVPAGEIPIDSALGPIDADYYYGEPTINYRSSIKGFWSMWGGFAFPWSVSEAGRQYDFLTQNGTITQDIPFIGFQGYKDPVFPIRSKYQKRYFPYRTGEDSIYTRVTNCIIHAPFEIYNKNKSNPTPDYRIECSNDIYNLFKPKGVPVLMYIDCKMGHGLSPEDTLTGICPSDFGVIGDLTTEEVNEYLASRAAFFFQAIMNGTAGSLQGTSRFVNCEDFRYSAGECRVEASNNSCNNNDSCSKSNED